MGRSPTGCSFVSGHYQQSSHKSRALFVPGSRGAHLTWRGRAAVTEISCSTVGLNGPDLRLPLGLAIVQPLFWTVVGNLA
jgi:hypothetical protein